MADVQFADAGERGHAADVGDRQAVPGVRLPAGGEAAFGRRLDLRELGVGFGASDAGVGVGVQFEAGDVVLVGQRRELFQVGVDEDGDADAGLDQAAGGVAHLVAASDQIEAAFGGHLVGPFGNQRHLVRLHPLREPEHRLLGRDLEVEPARDRLPEVDDVLVLNVAAVLAQMHGDAEGAGFLGEARRFQRARVAGESSLSQRRDMVDVDGEMGHGLILDPTSAGCAGLPTRPRAEPRSGGDRRKLPPAKPATISKPPPARVLRGSEDPRQQTRAPS